MGRYSHRTVEVEVLTESPGKRRWPKAAAGLAFWVRVFRLLCEAALRLTSGPPDSEA
jgi:hypothetical protein